MERAAALSTQRRLEALIDGHVGQDQEELAQVLGPLLVQGDYHRLWLAEHLTAMQGAEPRLPAGYADPVCQSVVLLDHGGVHLSLAIVTASGWQAQSEATWEEGGIVGFADGWTWIRFLDAPDVLLQQFVLDGEGEGQRAVAEYPVRVTTGDTLRLANACESFRFTYVGADIVMLRMLVRDPDAREATECDARSGAVLRRRQAQSHDGRTQMLVSLLRSLGRKDAVPVIAANHRHWPDHLRWHGVREALATDTVEGFRLLQALAAGDPDDGLRAQAKRVRDDLIGHYPQLSAALPG